MAKQDHSISIVGRLTKDPEKKEFGNGGAVAKCRIASSGMDKDGKDTVFLDFDVGGKDHKRADTFINFFKKGDLVHLKGDLTQREHTAEDGKRTTYYGVRVSDWFFAGGGGKSEGASQDDAGGFDV